MEHKPKEGDISRALQWTHLENYDFEEIAVLKESYGEGQTLHLQRGTWKVKYGNFEQVFVTTEDKPVTFKRIDD